MASRGPATTSLASGDLVEDLTHNFFLETGARNNKLKVYEMVDHPAARALTGYLLVRGGVHQVAYARAVEKLTGADLTKMFPAPRIPTDKIPECQPHIERGDAPEALPLLARATTRRSSRSSTARTRRRARTSRSSTTRRRASPPRRPAAAARRVRARTTRPRRSPRSPRSCARRPACRRADRRRRQQRRQRQRRREGQGRGRADAGAVRAGDNGGMSALLPPLARPDGQGGDPLRRARADLRGARRARRRPWRAAVAGAARVAVFAEPRLETCVAAVGALRGGRAVHARQPEGRRARARAHPVRQRARAGADGRGVELPAAFSAIAARRRRRGARAATRPRAGRARPRGAGASSSTPRARPARRRAPCCRAARSRRTSTRSPTRGSGPATTSLAHALPLFHVHGLILGVLGPLRLGGTVHHLGRFDSAGHGGRARRPRDDDVRRPDDVPPARGRRRAGRGASRAGDRAGARARVRLGRAARRRPRADRAADGPADRRALRDERDADEHRGARRRRAPAGHRRAAAARRRPAAGRRRRRADRRDRRRDGGGDPGARPEPLPRVPQPPRRDRRGRCATAGSRPATWPRAPTTATSGSSAAARPTSSRAAATRSAPARSRAR